MFNPNNVVVMKAITGKCSKELTSLKTIRGSSFTNFTQRVRDEEIIQESQNAVPYFYSTLALSLNWDVLKPAGTILQYTQAASLPFADIPT